MPESFIDLSETGNGPVNRLRDTITEFNGTTAKQTAQLLRLTRALVVLTGLLFVGLVIQIAIVVLNLPR